MLELVEGQVVEAEEMLEGLHGEATPRGAEPNQPATTAGVSI